MPPAFALSQDQTLRFIAPQPKGRSAQPANSSITHHHIATRPFPPDHQAPRSRTAKHPPKAHRPQAAPPAHPTPHPSKRDRPQNTHHRTPPPSHPTHRNSQTATLSQTRFQNRMHLSKNSFPAAAPRLDAPVRPA